MVTKACISFLQEYAYYLMLAAHISGDFNRSHPLFWDSMPKPHEVHDFSFLTDEELQWVQELPLRRRLMDTHAITTAIFNGAFPASVLDGAILQKATVPRTVAAIIFEHKTKIQVP
jgi:hypothetical protein